MKSFITSQRAGIFSTLKDTNQFNQVDLVYGAATWPGGMDLAPDAMYDEIKKKGKLTL